MKKSLNQKIAVVLLLTTLALSLSAAPARAQEVELIPPAGQNEVNVEAAPYQGQQYQVRQAGITDCLSLPFGTIGCLFNIAIGVAENKINVGKWVGEVFESLVRVTVIALVGEAALENIELTAYDSPPQNYGALGVVGGMVGTTLQGPPDLQTAAFFKDTLADNIFASRSAYAAAVDKRGSDFFDPIRSIWTLFRDLSYVFMALILTVMGLMIMTRRKIDPRTTMTVSAALPRVAMAIVLIAFSYPLAGIIFDIARLLKGMIDSVFVPYFVNQSLPVTPEGTLLPIEPFQIFLRIGNSIKISQLYTGGTGVFTLIVALVIFVALFFVAFSLFFTLVIRFANLFVQVIFAPFSFLWGMIPGQEDTVNRWFRGFLVNTLSFPAIYFLINFALLITELGRSGYEFGLPPGLGADTLYGFERNIAGFVAFGIVLAATKVPEILEDAFEVAPSAHVARAGVEPTKVASRIPLIGGLFK